MPGFGYEPFGVGPFGDVDWARIVLWDELPEDRKYEDLQSGGWYYKFVTCLAPSFNELRYLIYRSHDYVLDPRTARKDLLGYIAKNFGIVPDFAEPEAYQRTKIEIAGRWRLIKGKKESYEVLCAIHGFNVIVKELWWNGHSYSENKPIISNDVIGNVLLSSFSGRLFSWPIKSGTLSIEIDDGINPKLITDNGDGTLSGDATGTIDYSYGFVSGIISGVLPLVGTDIKASYESIEGGCYEDYSKCATHFIRLDITPGSITGSSEFTIADAWSRLFEKINRDIKPIHVEILPETYEEYFIISIGYRFDIIPTDDSILDTDGLHLVFDDTSW